MALLVANGLGLGAKAVGLVGGASKTAFLAEADAICSPANAQLGAIPTASGYPAVAAAASAFVTTAGAQVGSLRRLDLPGFGDRARARGVLAAMSATVDAGRRLQTGAAAGDAAMTAAASRTMSLHAGNAATRAKAFGFTACATGMQPGVDIVLAGADGAVKASLIGKASVLCGEMFRASDALPMPKTISELDWFIAKNTALYEKFVVDFKALPAPRGDDAVLAEMATGVSNLGVKLRQMGGAAINGDVKRLNALEQEGDALADELNAKFNAYGLTVCGS